MVCAALQEQGDWNQQSNCGGAFLYEVWSWSGSCLSDSGWLRVIRLTAGCVFPCCLVSWRLHCPPFYARFNSSNCLLHIHSRVPYIHVRWTCSKSVHRLFSCFKTSLSFSSFLWLVQKIWPCIQRRPPSWDLSKGTVRHVQNNRRTAHPTHTNDLSVGTWLLINRFWHHAHKMNCHKNK